MSGNLESVPRTSPLHEFHVTQGAKLADFAGWLMPIEYDGITAEHQQVREAVGIFDVSHMGTIIISGESAVDLADQALALDVAGLESGQAAYGLCLNESGGVVDDLLVYRRSPTELVIVPNASNTSQVVAALTAILAKHPQWNTGPVNDETESAGSVAIADISAATAIIAIQGPKAGAVLADLGLVPDLDYMSFVDVADHKFGVEPILVARSGYTGEYGFELVVAVAAAPAVWQAALDSAERLGGGPVGLGARDTLRLEMGYPLHGNELAPDRLALMAPVSWTIGWDKPYFVGQAALDLGKRDGVDQILIGLEFIDRGIPRSGMTVLSSTDPTGSEYHELGVITSGTFSPTRKVGIALALVDRELLDRTQTEAVGLDGSAAELIVDVRGRHCRARVVKPPFVDSTPRALPI